MTRTDTASKYVADTMSPSRARQAVRSFCADNALEHLVDDAVLLTSEVMTNACRVAVEDVTMVLVLESDSLIVIISDDSSDRLSPRDHVYPLAESGRGLLVLDRVAGAWGSTSTSTGKNVWFRLP